jgi:competence protein ComGC
MKTHNYFKNIVICLIMVCMSAVAFIGCQSKSTTSSTSKSTTSSTNKSTASSDDRKTQIQNNIKSLVTDGTITQSQSDKIVAALTSNPTGNQQGGQPSGQPNSNSKPSGKPSDNQNKGQKPQNSPLSKLVSDGTITQAQADAVMKKLGKGSQGSNGQPSSNK